MTKTNAEYRAEHRLAFEQYYRENEAEFGGFYAEKMKGLTPKGLAIIAVDSVTDGIVAGIRHVADEIAICAKFYSDNQEDNTAQALTALVNRFAVYADNIEARNMVAVDEDEEV